MIVGCFCAVVCGMSSEDRVEQRKGQVCVTEKMCVKNASRSLDRLIRLMFFFIRHFKCQGIGGFSVNLNSITWQALIAH